LIYDVGFHNGNDTAFYLHQGFRVVAIEADPDLAEQGRRRFREAIATGRLQLLHLGIAETSGTLPFYRNEVKSIWNSFRLDLVSRNGLPFHVVTVPAVRFGEVLAEHGVPYYLKIDIEGNDHLCLRDLDPENLPKYVSLEVQDHRERDETGAVESLLLLSSLGYQRFKLIRQWDWLTLPLPLTQRVRWMRRLSSSMAEGKLSRLGMAFLGRRWSPHAQIQDRNHWRFERGSSGPWGEGTLGKWMDLDQARDTYLEARRVYFADPANPDQIHWDWHARAT
jgi:FkbM family methyltransferase